MSEMPPAVSSSKDVPLGLASERTFVRALRDAGFLVETSRDLDRRRKTDVLILGMPHGPLPRAVHVQFTTIRRYLPKMERFLRIRELRHEHGLYLECPYPDTERIARAFALVLAREFDRVRLSPRVLFMDMGHGGMSVSDLGETVARIHEAMDQPAVEARRQIGTVTSVDCIALHAALVRTPTGEEIACAFKSCRDVRLHTYLVQTRYDARMTQWAVPVSFVPPNPQADHPFGYALRFADPLYGNWLTRYLRELYLLRVCREATPTTADESECLDRLLMTTRWAIRDLIFTGRAAKYHIPPYALIT